MKTGLEWTDNALLNLKIRRQIVRGKLLLIISTVLVLSMLLVPSVSLAAESSGTANDASSVDWSDPVVLKNLYEKIKDAEDPDKAFAELPSEAQEALMDAFTKEIKYKTVVTQDIERGTGDLTITIVGDIFPFGEVWWFHQRVRWYYDGTYVTGIPIHQSWGEAEWPFSYQGIISESETGGVGYTYFHRFSQGKFTMNIAGWPVLTMTPWIDQWVYGTGYAEWETGD